MQNFDKDCSQIRSIVYESEYKRELSDEDKLEIASKLFENGEWKSTFGELMIKAHRKYGNRDREKSSS